MSPCVRFKECKTFWIHKTNELYLHCKKIYCKALSTQYPPLAPWNCNITDNTFESNFDQEHICCSEQRSTQQYQSHTRLPVPTTLSSLSDLLGHWPACLPSPPWRDIQLWKAPWALTEPSVGCASNMLNVAADKEQFWVWKTWKSLRIPQRLPFEPLLWVRPIINVFF